MNKMLITIVFVITTLSVVAVAWVKADEYLKLKRQEIDNRARYECAQTNRVEVKESDNITGFYPATDLYLKCLKEKGL